VIPTTSAVQKVEPKKEAPVAQKQEEAVISGAPPAPEQPQVEHRVVAKEEKVEYRDQDGNLLDPEEVKALEGKVEFKTKYETKTRVVDEQGNEVQEPVEGWDQNLGAGVAPPHPDVEGINSETVKAADEEVVASQDVAASKDGEKEAEEAMAKPASENPQDATVKEEL
jgi:dolichyl-phosphate-mannose-protein mannosyltransferase